MVSLQLSTSSSTFGRTFQLRQKMHTLLSIAYLSSDDVRLPPFYTPANLAPPTDSCEPDSLQQEYGVPAALSPSSFYPWQLLETAIEPKDDSSQRNSVWKNYKQ